MYPYVLHLDDMIVSAEADVEHCSSFMEPSPLSPEGSQQRPRASDHLHVVSDNVHSAAFVPKSMMRYDAVT